MKNYRPVTRMGLGVTMKRATLTMNEHHIVNEQGVQTDIIIFNDEATITSWMVRSGELDKFFSLPLELIEDECPGKLELWQDKIVNEIIPEGRYSSCDDYLAKKAGA